MADEVQRGDWVVDQRLHCVGRLSEKKDWKGNPYTISHGLCGKQMHGYSYQPHRSFANICLICYKRAKSKGLPIAPNGFFEDGTVVRINGVNYQGDSTLTFAATGTVADEEWVENGCLRF